MRRLFLSLPLPLPGSPPGSSDVPSAAPAVPIDMDGESGDVSCGATAAPLDRRLPGASVESPKGGGMGVVVGETAVHQAGAAKKALNVIT
jgi:hypothetical protein